MKLYKLCSLISAIIFGIVGLIFLFFPDLVLTVLNSISPYFNMRQSPVQGVTFYLTLASAYMYLVTLFAYLMYRYPKQYIYPYLLIQGKLASAVIAIYLFLASQPYLIYLATFVIDGLITIGTFYLMKVQKSIINE